MNLDIILKELTYSAAKSSGPGGQHVNKTASKVTLYFSIHNSNGLSQLEKEKVAISLKNRINSEGILLLSSGKTRSQHLNKTVVTKRLVELLENCLKKSKFRKKTRPTRGSVEKRLKSKKNQALKKSNRKNPSID